MATCVRDFVLSMAIVLMLAGCGSMRAKTVIVHGRYAYVLAGPRMEYEHVGKNGIYWKTTRWELQVDNNQQIFFDQQNIGEMQEGDELEITWDGRVFLNQKELVVSN